MFEWLSQLPFGQLIAILAVIGGLTIPIIGIIFGTWANVRRAEYRSQQAEAETAIKQQMIERGMSADEIERVLAAGQSKTRKQKCCSREDLSATL